MGQAKVRGTFEQRRAEAIERYKKRAEELRVLEVQRLESQGHGSIKIKRGQVVAVLNAEPLQNTHSIRM